jgi:UDP-N-acetylmuramoyl-L-alanyl-D-glutamate--2,6-diaminopimelate ligase
MRLEELIDGLDVDAVRGDVGVEVADLAYDNTKVGPGTLFFCVRGERADGHEFAAGALERGAVALVVERELELDVPQVRVANSRAAMAPLAVRFWGDPTGELTVAGITGTNGKTTTTFLLRHILERAGRQTGLLGTVKRIVGGVEQEVERTTPEAIDLQRTFRRMLDRGDEACTMEVSSHALALDRAEGIGFDVKVFTNLTQDHLDFHADMEDYFQAKRRLFTPKAIEDWRREATAVINVDDRYGARLANELTGAGAPLLTFSASGGRAGYRAHDIGSESGTTSFRCVAPGEVEARVTMPLRGHFNVDNALAALAAAEALGIELSVGAAALADAGQVPGRFEPIDEGQDFTVVVDYAHTPDSLDNVLRAARRLTDRRLISVFGCGGDRDRDKRPQMGRIGAELSDLAIVTSDNPRSEEPGAIIEQILAGSGRDRVEVEPDRRAAIALALEAAEGGDAVVIAGKGHEQGQEFEAGRKVPFDDREVAREELQRLAAAAA